MTNILGVEDLSFAYRTKRVVNEISLQIEPGQFWGIIGPNGSGKSTLLKLISGFLKPSNGSISLLGQPLSRLSPQALARSVAVVRQDLENGLEMTVAELVLLGRFPHLPPLGGERPKDRAIAQEKMVLTGIDQLADRRLNEISGGERQRAYLAQALTQEPKLLLLDEPTAHLDIRHQVGIMGLVQRLSEEQGLTIIAVLHDLNLASLYCNRLALLANGQLLAHGETNQVLTEELIHAAYGVNTAITPHPTKGCPQVHLLPQ